MSPNCDPKKKITLQQFKIIIIGQVSGNDNIPTWDQVGLTSFEGCVIELCMIMDQGEIYF